jgi:predicted DsbA family dithiol-disulfide isomerase
MLFDNQEALTEANYASFAATLGLDMTKFTESRNSKEASDVVNADLAYGEAIGINATPTFYLDGMKMDVISPQDLNNQVVKALQK